MWVDPNPTPRSSFHGKGTNYGLGILTMALCSAPSIYPCQHPMKSLLLPFSLWDRNRAGMRPSSKI